MRRQQREIQILVVTAALVVSLLLNHGVGGVGEEWDDQDFFEHCKPDRCSDHGPEIRFPLQLQRSGNTTSSSVPSLSSPCRAECIVLSCSGEDTILHHQLLGPCNVTSIDYQRAVMAVVPLSALHSSPPACRVHKLFSRDVPDKIFSDCGLGGASDSERAILLGCSREFTPSGTAQLPSYNYNEPLRFVVAAAADYVVGPISCLSNSTYFAYLVHAEAPMSLLPSDCRAVSNGSIPIGTYVDGLTFKQMAERTISFSEITIGWIDVSYVSGGDYFSCTDCERGGGRCAFSSQKNKKFCMPNTNPHGSRVKVIAATSSVAALVALSLMLATALYFSLKTRYNEEIHLKVEMFLKTYGTLTHTRYTFSEVKKIAKRFKDKIGQGGFGSVYRGELPNGVPVAVKVLESFIGEGEEFINEVATIGKIHHANIVRLLGFCSEGTRRALIYEFMPHESLEKYIFMPNHNVSQEILVPNKMLDIALGIARGMEYLHQGCNQRILHFDIKPHNILLDYNFNPKISDFGLAKLCARDQSIITLTAARGTMGYIAPELYSRNFGGISYKSDVYSFGMLVLELVSGRRNSDPNMECQDEVYLPEWVYERVITGQDLVLGREMTQEEKEKVRQLAIVALWCIQWNPKDRPSTTKVVNMITGGLQNLHMPPKPFVSSESHAML